MLPPPSMPLTRGPVAWSSRRHSARAITCLVDLALAAALSVGLGLAIARQE